MSDTRVHVAVAAIVNQSHEVLISKRPESAHQGGLWEFPGGKLEAGESVTEALVRELNEELGIQLKRFRPLIKLEHHYTDKSVLLDVWKIDHYEGEAVAAEGQPIRWQRVDDLDKNAFPAANAAIIRALSLPDQYLISGDFDSTARFEAKLCAALARGNRLIQLRLTQAWLDAGNENSIAEIVFAAKHHCARAGALLMLNLPERQRAVFNADGVHLNSQQLMQAQQRPGKGLLSASCHNVRELEAAQKLRADFIVLSPVQATKTHPDAEPLGWKKFAALVSTVNVPVYALGGVNESDKEKAWLSGAQGIAAIRSLWDATGLN